MTSKEELSGQGEPERFSHQSQSSRTKWRPQRFGYGGRQWSHRPMTELDNKITRQSHKEQQPFGSTLVDLGKDGKPPSEYLTEDGLKLLKVLALGERDREVLTRYAAGGDFDLRHALDELREYELIDESDPKKVGLLKERL